jgi:hypothetical protein
MTSLLVCGVATHAEARETSIADQYPSMGRSMRALGMGSAVLTKKGRHVQDMYYNPATLSDLKANWEFSALGLDVSFSKALINTVKDVLSLSDDIKNASGDSAKIGAFETFFNKRVGEFQSVDIALPLFSMGRKNMGLAVQTDLRTTFSLRNRAFPNFELRSRNQAGVAAGYAQPLLYGDLVLGVMGKAIYALEIDKIITTGDILASNLGSIVGFDQFGRGLGFGANFGARYRIPIFINPVIAVTYNDIGHTRFIAMKKNGGPDKIRQSVNAAVGVHPKIGMFDLSVEAGATQITDKRDLLTRLRAGAELGFPRFGGTKLAIRGGTNQGYLAGGLSLDWRFGGLDLAYFGEEVGLVKRKGSNNKFAASFNTYF